MSFICVAIAFIATASADDVIGIGPAPQAVTTTSDAPPPTTSAATQSIASSQPTYPTTLPAAELATLIRKLDSDDPAAVDDAQKRLVALGSAARSALQARLAAQDAALDVLADMDRASLLLPTPVTLSLNDSPLDDAASAISKQIGFPITVIARREGTLPHVKLAAAGTPLWAVLVDLADQAKYRPFAGEDGITLRPRAVLRPPANRRRPTSTPATQPAGESMTALVDQQISIHGSTMTRISSIVRAAPRENPGAPGIMLHLSTLLEPKIHPLAFSSVATITQAVDARGRQLTAMPSNEKNAGVENPLLRHLVDTHVPISLPAGDAGGTIAELAGTIHLTVGVGERFVDASAVLAGHSVDLPIAGGETITLSDFQKSEDHSITLQYSQPRSPSLDGNDPPPLLVVTDDAGKPMVLGRSQYSTSETRQTGTLTIRAAGQTRGAKPVAATPTSIKLVVFARRVEVDVPFEFKDVPLP